MQTQTQQKCPWCSKDISVSDIKCPYCYVRVQKNNDSAPNEVSKAKKKTLTKTNEPPEQNLNTSNEIYPFREPEKNSKTCLAIDPGSRYTGISFIDGYGKVLHSTTLVRPKENPEGMTESEAVFHWLNILVDKIKIMQTTFNPSMMAIESVVEPKGHKGGVKAALNPKDIMYTGVIAGGLSVAFTGQSVFIKPGGNGSYPDSYYPSELIGRRDKVLPGNSNNAGTRNHEKSAYDVARQALGVIITEFDNF